VLHGRDINQRDEGFHRFPHTFISEEDHRIQPLVSHRLCLFRNALLSGTRVLLLIPSLSIFATASALEYLRKTSSGPPSWRAGQCAPQWRVSSPCSDLNDHQEKVPGPNADTLAVPGHNGLEKLKGIIDEMCFSEMRRAI